jgi:hypothetical protein
MVGLRVAEPPQKVADKCQHFGYRVSDGEMLVLSITPPLSTGCITCLMPQGSNRMSP